MNKKLSSFNVICIFVIIILTGLISTVFAAGQMREVAQWTHLYDSPAGTPLRGVALEPGMQVKELNRSNGGRWLLVQSDMGNGWVPAQAIVGAVNELVAAVTVDPYEEIGNARTVRWTHLYDQPAGKLLQMVSIPPNTPVLVQQYSADGHWALLHTSMGNGWSPTNALNVRAPQADTPAQPPTQPDTPMPQPDTSAEPESPVAEPTAAPTVEAETPADPEAAQPEPESPAEPEATQPEPETAVDTSTPDITAVVIDRIESHKAVITLSYTGIPMDGYAPFFYIFDPDNCIVDCDEPDNALDYPIHGITTITEGITPSGTIQVEVGIDNLYCGAEPFTRRLVAVVADSRPLNAGQSTTADDLVEFAFEHQWCQ